jgi:hypothetical protein
MSSTLRSRAQQRKRQSGQTRSAGSPGGAHLDFVADEVYNPPRLGILKSTGLPVMVDARGNTTGMSATWLITTQDGGKQIVSLQDVVEADFSRIPPTVEQVESILSNLTFQE